MAGFIKNTGNTLRKYTIDRKTIFFAGINVSGLFRITRTVLTSSAIKIGHFINLVPQTSLSIQIGQMSFDKKFSLDK